MLLWLKIDLISLQTVLNDEDEEDDEGYERKLFALDDDDRELDDDDGGRSAIVGEVVVGDVCDNEDGGEENGSCGIGDGIFDSSAAFFRSFSVVIFFRDRWMDTEEEWEVVCVCSEERVLRALSSRVEK